MLAAVSIYVGVFFLSHKAVTIQWSAAYSNNRLVSPYYASEGSSTCNLKMT